MTALTSPGFRSVGFRDIGSPAGVPQPVAGAIAVYRFDEQNLLKYSQDFGNAAWAYSAPVTITPKTALAPDGTMTAATYANSVSATNEGPNQLKQQIVTTVSGTISTLSIWLRSDTPNTARIGMVDVYVRDLAYKICNVTPDWQRFSVSDTFTSTTQRITIGPDGTNIVGSIYIWGAQLEVGSTPTEYFPTTDKQTLTDYSGNGNHGTLGSTSGVDTNDPTWTNQGLVYGADDNVKFGPIRNTAGVTQNLGAMLMAFYVPSAISAASTKTCSYSIGAGKAIYFGAVSGAPANNIVTVQYAAGSYTSWCSATDTIPAGWHTMEINWNGVSYDIYIDGIPKPVTTAGTPALLSLTDANCCYDGTIFGINGLIRAERRIYPVGQSYSDLMQARRIIASDAWAKGIALP